MDLSFLDIGFWDIIDILIVGYLFYILYRLLRGTLAFNIFIGMALLYGAWWMVRMLQMDLLSSILGQFFNIGLIILIIIFQPEVRRFLLVLGDTTIGQRTAFLKKIFPQRAHTGKLDEAGHTLIQVIGELSDSKTGAIIVLANNLQLDYFAKSGIRLQAIISRELIIGLFQKDNPCHDGAIVICGDRVERASVILPISDTNTLPSNLGLRHRAALGASEAYGVICIVVSEETGLISWAQNGVLRSIGKEDLPALLPLWTK